MADTATINLLHKKSSGYLNVDLNRLVKTMDVLVDGQKIDDVMVTENKYLSFRVAPGQHVVQMKWRCWLSQDIQVDVLPNTTITLEWGARCPYLRETGFVLTLFLMGVIVINPNLGWVFFAIIVFVAILLPSARTPKLYYLKKVEAMNDLE